jgi:hypothetical protein
LRREHSAAHKISERDLVAQHVANVIIRRDRIEVELKSLDDSEEPRSASELLIPFAPTMPIEKGIAHEPVQDGEIDAVAREKLLNAVRRASRGVGAVRSGKVEFFADIALQEGLGERHVRWLSPLAFLSPRLLAAILDGSASAGLTVARLAKALPPLSNDPPLFKMNLRAPALPAKSIRFGRR